MISGLRLRDSVDSLALVYQATVQAIAHGTRHILATMNAGGYRITTLFASGGDARNPLFLREHADITGCRVVLPKEPEAVLLGAAILGAVASGDQPSVLSAMGAMSEAARVIEPEGGGCALSRGEAPGVSADVRGPDGLSRADGDAGREIC